MTTLKTVNQQSQELFLFKVCMQRFFFFLTKHANRLIIIESLEESNLKLQIVVPEYG